MFVNESQIRALIRLLGDEDERIVKTISGKLIDFGDSAVPLLQEALVLALELVVEDNAAEPIATLGQPVGSLQVGSVHLGVMLQFPWLAEPGVERLGGVLAGPEVHLGRA